MKFLLLVFLLFVGAGTLLSRGRYRTLPWALWWCALLVPTSLSLSVGSIQFRFADVAAIVIVAGWCISPRTEGRFVLHPLDFLMAGLFLTDVVSEASHSNVGVATLPSGLIQWILPYAVGRICFSSRQEVTEHATWFTSVCCILGVMAIGEAITHINLAQLLHLA